MLTHAEKIAAAKRKAEEMKAKAAAKRAAKEAADAAGASGGTAEVDSKEERFVAGEHNLILVDWDDTLFPTYNGVPTTNWWEHIRCNHACRKYYSVRTIDGALGAQSPILRNVSMDQVKYSS